MKRPTLLSRIAIVVVGWTTMTSVPLSESARVVTASTPQTRLQVCPSDRVRVSTPAECGTIRVFENRRTRQGRVIDIAFARLRAERAAGNGAVFLLAGGPGSSGMSMAGLTEGWARPLRTTMDVVLVDQRGTGYSNPLRCPRDVEARPASSFGHVFPEPWIRQCRASLEPKADLRQYTTDFAADDLDDVRAALGYEQITLYGGSYGTRLAQAYMKRYAQRARAAVLDGTMPLDSKVPLTYAATSQQALDRVVEDCARTAECRTAHPALSSDFGKILARFSQGAVQTSVAAPGRPPVPVPMSRGDFGYAIRGMLYDAKGVRSLPDMIGRAAASGDISAFAQQYWERQVRFDRGFSTGLHLSVLCAEDVPFIQPQDVPAATTRTFLGEYLIDEYRRACALWPVAEIRPDFRQPVSASIPTLLISGYFDPVTPPEFAERIARSLTASRYIVARQGAHGSAGWCPAEPLFVLQKGTIVGMPGTCR